MDFIYIFGQKNHLSIPTKLIDILAILCDIKEIKTNFLIEAKHLCYSINLSQASS